MLAEYQINLTSCFSYWPGLSSYHREWSYSCCVWTAHFSFLIVKLKSNSSIRLPSLIQDGSKRNSYFHLMAFFHVIIPTQQFVDVVSRDHSRPPVFFVLFFTTVTTKRCCSNKSSLFFSELFPTNKAFNNSDGSFIEVRAMACSTMINWFLAVTNGLIGAVTPHSRGRGGGNRPKIGNANIRAALANLSQSRYIYRGLMHSVSVSFLLYVFISLWWRVVMTVLWANFPSMLVIFYVTQNSGSVIV